MESVTDWLKAFLGVTPIDAVLQLVMIATIVWLALRDPSAVLRERLDRHKQKIDDLLGRIEALEAEAKRSAARLNKENRSQSSGSQWPKSNTQPQYAGSNRDTNLRSNPSSTEPTVSATPIIYPTETRPPTRRLYAKSPEADGTFKAGNLLPEPNYDTLYVLSVDPGGVTARVGLHDSADGHQTAVQSPTIYLDPVCNYEHQPQHNASRIRTVSEGVAVLDGERWRMQRDLQIEFI